MKLFFAAFTLLLWQVQAFSASHVEARLVANQEVIEKGTPFKLGVHLKMSDHWHTYWENPGSSGLPTSVTFEPIAGLKTDGVQFPLPKKFVDDAEFVTYGFDDEALLIVAAEYTGDASQIEIKAKVEWLECKELCIPGSAEVSLPLAVGQARAANTALFDRFQARIPRPYGADTPFQYTADFQFGKDKWTGKLIVTPKPGQEWPSQKSDFAFFPLRVGESDADLTNDQVTIANGKITFDLTYDAYIEERPVDLKIGGVLKVNTTAGLLAVRLPLFPGPSGAATVPPSGAAPTPTSGGYTLWLILLFAFIGGVILNAMPCVLPVLSLKVFSIIQEAGESSGVRIRHAWIYTLGICASFLVISLFFVGAKLAGGQLGIGFQFQSPAFVIFMILLIFVMSLSFFGVFHIEPPNSNKLFNLTRQKGWQGSFFQGALMTVLSTPCTAPLLGTAYGWALSQSSGLIILTFQIIALGLAFPYLLLCHSPALLKYLPKPGAWMNHFKVSMGFLLAATVVWLLSVLYDLTGKSGVVGTMVVLLGFAWAAYIYGQTFHTERRVRGLIMTLLLCGAAFYFGMFRLFDIRFPAKFKLEEQEFLRLQLMAESETDAPGDYWQRLEAQKTTAAKIAWIPYSPQGLEFFRKKNRIVFLDFTASWCLTCKANERLFIDTADVRQALSEADTITMKVDYTDRSDEITSMLNQFQRAGVPLYVFYPGQGEPIVLPEAITGSMLIEAINQASVQLGQRTGI